MASGLWKGGESMEESILFPLRGLGYMPRRRRYLGSRREKATFNEQSYNYIPFLEPPHHELPTTRLTRQPHPFHQFPILQTATSLAKPGHPGQSDLQIKQLLADQRILAKLHSHQNPTPPLSEPWKGLPETVEPSTECAETLVTSGRVSGRGKPLAQGE